MKEKALFIIKPDGFGRREEIKTDISQHFRLTEAHLFQFSPNLLSRLYPYDVGKAHYGALVDYMLESLCELGIIEGESAIRVFLELCGKSPNPRECGENTLRSKYGVGLDRTKSGLYIVKNAIHRAKSAEEFAYEQDLFKTERILS